VEEKRCPGAAPAPAATSTSYTAPIPIPAAIASSKSVSPESPASEGILLAWHHAAADLGNRGQSRPFPTRASPPHNRNPASTLPRDAGAETYSLRNGGLGATAREPSRPKSASCAIAEKLKLDLQETRQTHSARGPLSMNLRSPGSPLTPTLSPSAGAREPKARMIGFRGPMRERPPRGILTPALSPSDGAREERRPRLSSARTPIWFEQLSGSDEKRAGATQPLGRPRCGA
jgi:hypothetical protein